MATGIRGIVRIDYSKCTQCLRCVELCPAQALEVVEGRPRPIEGACIACFGCQSVCPQNAIVVELDESTYEVLEPRVGGLDKYFGRQ